MSDEGEIEYLDEDADIVQQCVQNVESLQTQTSPLLIERQKPPKRKRNYTVDDDFDPIEHLRQSQGQRKRKSQHLPQSTPVRNREVKIKTPQHTKTVKAAGLERDVLPTHIPNRLKLGIRIPDYDDPLCLPVRAIDKDNVPVLRAWNNTCLEQFKRAANPLRAKNSESVSSRRIIVLQKDRLPGGNFETRVYSKVCVENEKGAKKAELIQAVLPKYREKKIIYTIRFVQKKRNYRRYQRELILTKEINKGEENLVVYDPKDALSAVYRMKIAKSTPVGKEEDDKKYLEELTCCKVCAQCYQGSWRGLQKHFNKKVLCPVCGEPSANVYKLLPHLKGHAGVDVRQHRSTLSTMLKEAMEYHYKCRICQEACPSIKSLKHHVDTHKGTSLFVCAVGDHVTK